MRTWLEDISWGAVLLACATLGLAPFLPPHVWEKLTMLFNGQLTQALDIFDLLFHGAPWLVLMAKAVLTVQRQRTRALQSVEDRK